MPPITIVHSWNPPILYCPNTPYCKYHSNYRSPLITTFFTFFFFYFLQMVHCIMSGTKGSLGAWRQRCYVGKRRPMKPSLTFMPAVWVHTVGRKKPERQSLKDFTGLACRRTLISGSVWTYAILSDYCCLTKNALPLYIFCQYHSQSSYMMLKWKLLFETLSHTDVENNHNLFFGWCFILSGEPVYCMPGQQCRNQTGIGIHTNQGKKKKRYLYIILLLDKIMLTEILIIQEIWQKY